MGEWKDLPLEEVHFVTFAGNHNLAPKVLIVDEFGIWPYDRESATALFTLVSARYERGSIILTSNKGFSESGELLGDTVIAGAPSWIGCSTTPTL